MAATTVLVALASAASPPADAHLPERVPLPTYVHTSSGAAAWMDRLRAAFEPATDLTPVPVFEVDIDPARFMACVESAAFGCLVDTLRASRVSPDVAPFVLILTVAEAGEGEERIAAVVLDVKRAYAAYDYPEPGGPGFDAQVEAQIFRDAVHSRSTQQAAGEDSRRAFLDELVRDRLRSVLGATLHWRPNGKVAIKATRPGLKVLLNGVDVATTGEKGDVLDGVAPGQHAIQLVDPTGTYIYGPLDVDVQVGASVAVTPFLLEERYPAIPARVATFWGGLGVVAAGAGLVGYALFAPQDRPTFEICPRGMCPEGRNGFATFADLGGGPGIPVAPLGYSLMGAGAVWAIGSQIGEDSEMPWIAWIAGAALGGLSLTVSALAQ